MLRDFKKPPHKSLPNVELKKSLVKGTLTLSPASDRLTSGRPPINFPALNDSPKLIKFIVAR